MWCASCVVLLIGAFACITSADELVEPEQCYGPPPFDFRTSPDSCCKKPIFKAEVRDCLKTAREAIHRRYHEEPAKTSENKTETKISGDVECLATCLSSDDIFKNDKINRDELIKALETQTEDKAWTSIHADAVDKCIEVLKPDLKEIEADSTAGRKCNRVAVLTMICLNGQYFVRCPETHFQNDNQNCKKFQEHIKTCPMPRGGPFGRGFPDKKDGFGPGSGGPFGRGHFSPGHFGPGHFGPGHFGPGNFGPRQFGHGHFGKGPNFATGEVFGFL
ncbi:hypothetical protein HA402_003222 [Bradysia odoriphaga]|nr:hypothetical protein HA402_003222 [Bradysia odoriphaga]